MFKQIKNSSIKIFKLLGHGLSFLLLLPRVLFSLIFLLVIIAFIYGSIAGYQKDEPKDSALYIPLDGYLVEKSENINDLNDILFNQRQISQLQKSEIEDIISKAKNDSRIKGLVINFSNFLGGYPADLLSLNEAILDFKESDKVFIAYSDFYSQSSYLIASLANKIITHTQGGLFLEGYSSKRIYMKELMKNLGIEVIQLSYGNYKSALENFTLSEMSEEDKMQRTELHNFIWEEITDAIEANRGFKEGYVKNVIRNMDTILVNNAGNWAEFALKKGFVDELMNRIELEDYLNGQFPGDQEGWNFIDYRSYDIKDTEIKDASVIAKIIVSGPIVDGFESNGVAGGETISALIRDAVKQDVKAIVLRVSSPGGSAFASELIREQLKEAKNEGIPIVVSMGGVAASGGYWISVSSDHIFAEETTITGSIGVAAILFNAEEAIKKIGLKEDGVSFSPISGTFENSIFLSKPNEQMISLYESTIHGLYDNFIHLVSEERNLSKEEVESLGQGRIWVGKDAKRFGLIDEIGSLKDAEETAANLANLENYIVKEFEQKRSPFLEYLSFFVDFLKIYNNSEFKFNKLDINHNFYNFFNNLSIFDDPRSIYYLCYECLTIN
jgi:protease-4